MLKSTRISQHRYLRLGIVNFFICIGLLRLTNFNYYLSQALGFETQVNNTGGDAFNFINYLGTAMLVTVVIAKIGHFRAQWRNGWPIYTLMLIYGFNILVTPYGNPVWLIYQEVFLAIALLLHFYVQRVEDSFERRFRTAIRPILYCAFILVIFCTFQILTKNSLSYYLQEFNEVFVQTLDDYGIMKQRYGYLQGFLVSYVLFMVRGWTKRIGLILLILITGFGIRSFVIGLFGGLLWSVARKPIHLLFLGSVFIGWLILSDFSHVYSLIYNTRFYSYLNMIDIMNNYPFGVGLGGYHVYTETYSRVLFAHFYDVNAILDYVPVAPESDVVYVFGSLGWFFGGLHFFLIARILYWSIKYQKQLSPFHKTILFYFCFMTFFGISEDSMFSINYWIFFGLSSGIISLSIFKNKHSEIE